MKAVMSELRKECDKFEALEFQLADAICSYFYGAMPPTVINLVHSCHSLTKNLTNYFVNEQLMPPLDLWSEIVDRKAVRKYFKDRDERSKAKGAFNAYGNFVKHADRHPTNAVIITDQLVFAYLYATIVDYLQLKTEAQKAGLLQSTEIRELKGRLRDSWLRNVQGIMPEALKRNAPSRTEALCGIFLQWYDLSQFEKRCESGSTVLDVDFYKASAPVKMPSMVQADIIFSRADGIPSMLITHVFLSRLKKALRGSDMDAAEKDALRTEISARARLGTKKFVTDFIHSEDLGMGQTRGNWSYLKEAVVERLDFSDCEDSWCTQMSESEELLEIMRSDMWGG